MALSAVICLRVHPSFALIITILDAGQPQAGKVEMTGLLGVTQSSAGKKSIILFCGSYVT